MFKSLARDDTTGLYVAFIGSFETFTSRDGMSWQVTNQTGLGPPDNDDSSVIFSNGQFVEFQVESHLLAKQTRFCDEAACNFRRLLGVKTSTDGAHWSNISKLIVPDAHDPPDVQFYRSRPFFVGHTKRLAAHTLLYAAAPAQKILNRAGGTRYGMHPMLCRWQEGRETCHGPHMYQQLWLGPVSGDASDAAGWRRPLDLRRSRVAPADAYLMSQPAAFEGSMLWLGSTVYTLPMYRIAGLYAPANGEVTTVDFVAPAANLWVDADVRWKREAADANAESDGHCDMGCA
jgi:hypothetical protein